MKVSKLLIAAVLVIAIGSPIAGFVGHIKLPLSTTPTGEPVAFFHGLGTGPAANQSGLASLERADAWLNSPPLTASALGGKVVLVDFWTYTCINWLRTLPYVRAWAQKYKDPEIRRAEDIAPAFKALEGRVQALYVSPDALVITNRARIHTLAMGVRLPTMYASREYVEAGGLMSYGVNLPGQFRRTADYVDKILRGAKPGDIPVEQPTKFDLIINLTTAKALGLAIPESFLLRADEVIE